MEFALLFASYLFTVAKAMLITFDHDGENLTRSYIGVFMFIATTFAHATVLVAL